MKELQQLTPIQNDYPLDRTLCTFKTKRREFFTGYMDWSLRIMSIKVFGQNIYYDVNDIHSYQYVFSEHGRFLFVKENKK